MNKPIVIRWRGKVLAAIVSPEDLALLEQVHALEDAEDREAVLQGRKETGRVPWETLRKRLNLK